MQFEKTTNISQWPTRSGANAATDAFRKAFGMRLGELMHRDGLNARTLRKSAGVSNMQVGKWLRGEAAPLQKSAKRLCKAFKVTPAQLAGIEPVATLPASATPGNGNGHAPATIAPTPTKKGRPPLEPTPLPPLPKNAPPPSFELKTYKADARFFTLTIGGTYDIDTAMAMLALHRQATNR